VLKALSRTKISPLSIAEVGCGAGGVLAALQPQFAASTFDGYDISPQAIRLAQHSGIKFHCQDFTRIERSFDLVLLLDVVEHVEDCFGFLSTIRERTEHVIVHFPLDMSAYGILRGTPMCARHADGHLHYFCKDTALATLQDCGYSIVDWFYTPKQELVTGFKNSISHFVRRAVYGVSPDFTVLALGCYGLLVTAKSARAH
jgi:SAM-dependent methyltransferase